jgi:XTP/dITP diphosphohydrolase
MEIVIATHNEKKRAELQRILIPLGGFRVVSRELSDVEENGASFEENARLKAESGCYESGLPCVGDDSGLCVDALNGAPGVYSARFSGTHGDDAANIKKLLYLMQNVEISLRSARFICSICCKFPDGREIVAQGSCEGKIALASVGTGGFGYDPVFLPEEAPGLTMAQLDRVQKDAISHRGKAMACLVRQLEVLHGGTA